MRDTFLLWTKPDAIGTKFQGASLQLARMQRQWQPLRMPVHLRSCCSLGKQLLATGVVMAAALAVCYAYLGTASPPCERVVPRRTAGQTRALRYSVCGTNSAVLVPPTDHVSAHTPCSQCLLVRQRSLLDAVAVLCGIIPTICEHEQINIYRLSSVRARLAMLPP